MENPQPQADAPDQAPQAQPELEQSVAAEAPVNNQQQPKPEDTPADNPDTSAEDKPDDIPEPGEDDFDYEAWLEKKGIDPSTPEGKTQIAKSWRAMEQKMHQSTQQASELEKQIQGQPAQNDDERVQRLEMLYNANTWKQQKGITAEQDEAMGTYLTSNPDKLALVKHGLLTFDDVLNMSGAAQVDTAALKKQGGQEALQTLANKQRATAPRPSASQQAAPAKEDPIAAALAD